MELVRIAQMLGLEPGGEVRRVEMRSPEKTFAIANLHSPERFDKERLLDEAGVMTAVSGLERQ